MYTLNLSYNIERNLSYLFGYRWRCCCDCRRAWCIGRWRRYSKSICMETGTIAIHQNHCGWKIECTTGQNSVGGLTEERFACQQTCRIEIVPC